MLEQMDGRANIKQVFYGEKGQIKLNSEVSPILRLVIKSNDKVGQTAEQNTDFLTQDLWKNNRHLQQVCFL